MSGHVHQMINSLVSKKLDAEMASISLRIPDDLNTELEELSGQVEVTKSALITRFIEASVLELRAALEAKNKDSFLPRDIGETIKSSQDRFFLVNTNFNNDPNDHFDMLKKSEVSAFFDDWKKNIAWLKNGDQVFLYQSGVGFVGYGVVNGDLIKSNYKSKADEKYSKKLDSFVTGFKPVKAREFKDLTKSNTSFRQVMVGLTRAQGEALRNEILRRSSV